MYQTYSQAISAMANSPQKQVQPQLYSSRPIVNQPYLQPLENYTINSQPQTQFSQSRSQRQVVSLKEPEQSENEEYEPLRIPADWEMARKHGLARSVGKSIEGKQEKCPCCGYDVHREQLDVLGSTRQLSFLGSGFPLFYNFVKFCIIILITYFCVKGAFNLITNLQGDFCDGVTENQKGQTCPNNWVHRASLANKFNRPDITAFSCNLNLVTLIAVTIILFYFRRSQREIDQEIDQEFVTPSDYTLMVKNIPRGLNVDYKEELKKIFTYYAVPSSETQVVVTKVELIYNIEELIKMEEELEEIVKEKQNKLKENNINYNDPKIKNINKKIEKYEKELHELKENIQKDGSKFSGIAFISFLTEQMKQEVYDNNDHTQTERISAYMNDGKSPNLTHKDLSWQDQKLFLEYAPEPNDVDWEFVHVSTGEKLLHRMKSWGISVFFMLLCFIIIYGLSSYADELRELDEDDEVETTPWEHWKMKIISGSISWVIVFFNKFIMGFTYHKIVDSERISSKTRFNIQFAFKLTVALFINTALLAYIVDILILGNIMNKGGFIQNETNVFILNALFPPLVWFIDPYNLLKKYQLNQELKKGKLSVVTQQEANFLMEPTEYYQAKRYADIMKTMWFTFLFGSCLPVGILFSIVGLSCYYWVDKYNVMRRRSIKDSLAKEVSIEMIENLELTIVFLGIGNMTMSYQFYGYVHWQDMVVFAVGILLAVLPMEDLNVMVFQFEDNSETLDYNQVRHTFQTDYDRENPITRTKALEQLKYDKTFIR